MPPTKQMTQILIRPVVTEKSTRLQESNKYTFEVALHSNKNQVKQAVEQLFQVKVLRVNVVRLPGKTKRYGMRRVFTSPRKKATVTLQAGQKITIFEGV